MKKIVEVVSGSFNWSKDDFEWANKNSVYSHTSKLPNKTPGME